MRCLHPLLTPLSEIYECRRLAWKLATGEEKRKKENSAKKNICQAPYIVLFKMLKTPGRVSKTQAQFTKSQIH